MTVLASESAPYLHLERPKDRLIAGAPLYAQIADALLGRMQRGELAACDMIHPER